MSREFLKILKLATFFVALLSSSIIFGQVKSLDRNYFKLKGEVKTMEIVTYEKREGRDISKLRKVKVEFNKEGKSLLIDNQNYLKGYGYRRKRIYDYKGKLLKIIGQRTIYSLDSIIRKDSTQFFISYNKKSFTSKEFLNKECLSTKISKLDDNGNVISKTDFFSDSNQKEREYFYEYNNKQQLTLIKYIDFKGGEVVKRFKYDVNKNRIEELEDNIIDGYVKKITRKYNNYNDVISKTVLMYKSERETTYEYRYDSHNNYTKTITKALNYNQYGDIITERSLEYFD